MQFKYNLQAGKTNAVAYALLRAAFGMLLMVNGWNNWRTIPAAAANFPDPLGIGPEISVYLAVFAQLFCGLAIAVGLLTRLAAVPVLVTFMVAVFLVHGNDPFDVKQAAILYLILSVYFIINGSGRFSLVALIRPVSNNKMESSAN